MTIHLYATDSLILFPSILITIVIFQLSIIVFFCWKAKVYYLKRLENGRGERLVILQVKSDSLISA